MGGVVALWHQCNNMVREYLEFNMGYCLHDKNNQVVNTGRITKACKFNAQEETNILNIWGVFARTVDAFKIQEGGDKN